MKDIIKIILGNIILTFAYALITVPNHIINGGVTSFSLIISQLINTDVTVIANIFTIILLLLSFIFLGKEFVLKSLLSSVCYMFFFELFSCITNFFYNESHNMCFNSRYHGRIRLFFVYFSKCVNCRV